MVASNLHPGMITLHMLLAQLIVAILIWAITRSQRMSLATDPIAGLPGWTGILLGAIMVVSLVQLVMGTQVREAVDLIARANNHTDRHLWIENLPLVYSLHQFVAVPVVLLNAVLLYLIFRSVPSGSVMLTAASALTAVLAGTVIMGLSMQRMHLPMYAQPLHLWLASLIFGLQFFIFIVWHYARASARATGVSYGSK